MKKYSMIAICSKIDDNNNLIIRRVLISYSYKRKRKKSSMVVYYRTHFLAMDPYFKDKTRSHQYNFFDDGYMLTFVEDSYAESLVGVRRPYHYYDMSFFPFHHMSIEFTAKTDEEAIEKFNSREKDS